MPLPKLNMFRTSSGCLAAAPSALRLWSLAHELQKGKSPSMVQTFDLWLSRTKEFVLQLQDISLVAPTHQNLQGPCDQTNVLIL